MKDPASGHPPVVPSALVRRYGPWAVVTGASDGIGRAFAEQLAAAGLNVVLIARRGTLLAEIAAGLEKRCAVRTRVLVLDLAEPDAAARLAGGTEDLDVGLVVAAAGFGTSGPLTAANLLAECEMIAVNCTALFAASHHFARRLVERGRGGLVLMSSLLAFQGVPRAANYAATKAYVQTLAEGLHRELAPSGVDVLACAPGPIRSGFESRANMRMSMGQTPDVVARGALAALGRKTTVRPGWLAKLLEASLALLPRRGRTLVMRQVMAGMTAHQTGPALRTPQESRSVSSTTKSMP